jgi:hypothetical protein
MPRDGTQAGNQSNLEATLSHNTCQTGVAQLLLLELFASTTAAIFECTVLSSGPMRAKTGRKKAY